MSRAPTHRPELSYRRDDEGYDPSALGLPEIAPSIFLDGDVGGGAGEPWGAQYQPDSYRLPDYNGNPPGPHFCRGAHGRSLSTSAAHCPEGQKPDRGAHHLSTETR